MFDFFSILYFKQTQTIYRTWLIWQIMEPTTQIYRLVIWLLSSVPSYPFERLYTKYKRLHLS